MSTPNDQRDLARIRDLYGRHRFGNFCYGDRRLAHNRPLCAFIENITADDHVFDIGCGTGYWLARCRSQVPPPARACGVELAPESAAALHREGFEVLCGDALNLGIATGAATVTMANGVIHHTPDPYRAFCELVRITRPGGRIFLAVYNRWNPWFYLVHRAMFPLRYAYWNGHPGVASRTVSALGVLYQPLARVALGAPLDRNTARTLIMDQIFTPYAHLFSKGTLRAYARRTGCTMESMAYTSDFMMLTAVFSVPD